MTVSGFRLGGCGSHRLVVRFPGVVPEWLQDPGVDAVLSVIEFQPSDQVVLLEAGRMACASKDIKQFSTGIVVFESGNASEHVGLVRDASRVPGFLRADDHAGDGHAWVVDVAEVAPVGDEHALRAVLRAVAGHAGDVSRTVDHLGRVLRRREEDPRHRLLLYMEACFMCMVSSWSLTVIAYLSVRNWFW